jgi:ribosome-associated protein
MLSLDQKIQQIISAAGDKRATDIVALDFREMEGAFTDAFIICSGSSERQIEAIATHIQVTLKASGFRPHHIEGNQLNRWILMDYGDVIVHIFLEHIREFYRLENLWGQRPRINLPAKG